MHHRLIATKVAPPIAGAAAPQPPQWPSYTGSSQFVGTSTNGRVNVFVDPSLGAPALANAQDLVEDANRVVSANDALFGTQSGPVSVIIFALGGATDGTGGADHMGCDYTTGAAIEVCASFGNSARVSALFEAELSECSMGNNLCGVSTGEALSRWCALVVGNNVLADFATAPTWARAGMPNYVDTVDPTDQSANSTGCGMAFISWLLSKGSTLAQIAQTLVRLGDSGTLAQLYANLTGDGATNAWPTFLSAVQALQGGVTTDDPFKGAPLPQFGRLTPVSAELAGHLFCAILSDLTQGKSEQTIVANVQTVLATHPAISGFS